MTQTCYMLSSKIGGFCLQIYSRKITIKVIEMLGYRDSAKTHMNLLYLIHQIPEI